MPFQPDTWRTGGLGKQFEPSASASREHLGGGRGDGGGGRKGGLNSSWPVKLTRRRGASAGRRLGAFGIVQVPFAAGGWGG